MNRRQLLGSTLCAPFLQTVKAKARRRAVVFMFDGFGQSYFDSSPMPTLKRWAAEGLSAKVYGQMPAVTNTNNASICCGVPASIHGITGNSYLNLNTGSEDFMEDGRLLLSPTLFQLAKQRKLSSGLFTSKKKTATLLNAGTSVVIAAESPSPDIVARYGLAPNIYSAEINYWLWDVVIDHLKTRTDLDVLYVHTTDYPMHMHSEQAPESLTHLAAIDQKLAQAATVASDVTFYISADHGMNQKIRAWDLTKACANRNAPIRLAISAERDKYPKHHRGLGGIAWVYLRPDIKADRVASVLERLPGVERIFTREEAAKDFSLMADRIGDIVVTADRETVFGDLSMEMETLDSGYRSHGSRYELSVPLVIYNKMSKGSGAGYSRNLDLTRGLLDNLA